MHVNELLHRKRAEILEIGAKHGAFNVRVFGSVVRGETTEHSDVDFLVLVLEALLDCKVDVVMEQVLKERIRAVVLNEAIPL